MIQWYVRGRQKGMIDLGKLKKAEDFYLRGFKSNYIKRRTDISIQSLLKQLLSKGVRYDKDDIINYQIAYINSKFTSEDVIDAYINISGDFDDIYKASKRKEIIVLGCCFGSHAKVFSSILGKDVYNELKSKLWKEKQTKTVKSKYGVDNIFRKEVFDDFVSDESIAEGRIKRNNTMLERYGVEEPLQNKDIYEKMRITLKDTNLDRYGVENAMQVPEISEKANFKRQETMKKRYGFKNSVEIKNIRDSIFKARRENGTLNTSRPEQMLGDLLVEHFGEDDVIHNKIIDKRYPYNVDYYIKSRDLFIELNGDRCHNNHWFNPEDNRDNQIVNAWRKNMLRIEDETGKSSRYRSYIRTWTETDVAKRNIARINNLNYLVFWDGSCNQKNKKQIPNLTDVFKWFKDGCPPPKNWHKENTY